MYIYIYPNAYVNHCKSYSTVLCNILYILLYLFAKHLHCAQVMSVIAGIAWGLTHKTW